MAIQFSTGLETCSEWREGKSIIPMIQSFSVVTSQSLDVVMRCVA